MASIPDLTDTLVALTNHPQELSLQSQYMQTLERFVVLMYSKGCGLVKVNEARYNVSNVPVIKYWSRLVLILL